jgi:hypothetical protein
MDQPKNANAPIPPRLQWFAPWRWTPWKRWTTCILLLVVFVGYPLSIGPAMRLAECDIISTRFLTALYRPLVRITQSCPGFISHWEATYVMGWIKDSDVIIDENGEIWLVKHNRTRRPFNSGL